MSNLAILIFGGDVPTGWAVFLFLVAVVSFALVALRVTAIKQIDLLGVGLAAVAGVFLWACINAA